jgi:aldehyde dehydrogenase (NAD+)
MGPLTSRIHQERVLKYCDVARREGGEFLTGGGVPSNPALARGCFVEPTVVRAAPHHTVCRDEVFGPFVTVTTFSDENEAIGLANDTKYGLGAGLWTRDVKRAHRVAKAIRSGMVWVNCYKRVHPASPFGGVGESGYGREMGFEVMREYTQAKSVWINVDAKIPPFYPR